MRATREPGTMDNPYYGWSPIVDRPPLRLPGGARVAVVVIVNVEQAEWLPPPGTLIPPSAVRFGPYPEIFDVHELSLHAYGNRVGVFRVMDALDRCGIRCTAAMDAASVHTSPTLVRRCVEREWEPIGHGLSFSRLMSEELSEAEERKTIQESLDVLERAWGRRPVGWLGPDYGESSRTVRLLAELGVRYVCDWPNDEQPYAMTVPAGEMISLPVAYELDDVVVMRERGVSVHHWARMVTESFDRLYEEGAASGRLLVLNLHPFVIGQPFRIRYLSEVLAHIVRRPDVWLATGGEVVDWYRSAVR